MTDRLTQLQDCLDDLLTQMYASLSYIQTRHSYANIEGQPNQAPQPTEALTAGNPVPGSPVQLTNGAAAAAGEQKQNGTSSPLPESPGAFHAALRELAQDLILKEQQVEHLINSLPGLGNSEFDQESRMRELESELEQIEAERERKEAEREAMINLLGQIIIKIKRVP